MQDKESKKTLTFILVAGMALLVAWEPWRPKPIDTSVPEGVGQPLFPDFTDPLAAKSLDIVTFNEENAQINDFRVSQVNGVWSIPSHSNYPADAQQHMADAATALMRLRILGLASEKLGDQELYGVITPDPKTLKPGMTGVGARYTVKDGKDKVLADLIVGKPVKDQPAQRYVRRAGNDYIYTVTVNTDKLSTKFGEWIEKDLLKLTAFDVRKVDINDYSSQAVVTPQGRPALQLDKRSEIELSFDDAKSTWDLVSLQEFDDKGAAQEVKLGEGEELNAEKLNNLKTALDDLQIVDVERKPTGLSRDLRASEEFLNDNEAKQSMAERGFIPVSRKAGAPPEIYSTEGEVTCTTKDGVRYVLRFGNLAAAGPDSGEKTPEGETKSSALNRFLFVAAEFDENQIPKPTFEPVPGEEPAAEAKPAEEKATEEKPAEEAPAADEKPAAEEKAAAEPAPETKTALQEEAPAAEAAAAPVEKPAEPAKPAEAAAEKTEPKADAKPATPEEEKVLAIKKENKRRQDEYDTAVKKGQDRVKELNDRFADWYFIISDDVYKKIHLGRKDIIKKKEVAMPEGGVNQLKELQKGLPGLNQPVPAGALPSGAQQ